MSEAVGRREALATVGKALGGCALAAAMLRKLEAADEPVAGKAAPAAGQEYKRRKEPDFPTTQNAKDAEAMFGQGFNCAQAVLSCCGKDYGVSREMGCRMGSAFVGGMGLMGLTCGSVTGAFMLVGMKHAQLDAKDAAPAGRANRVVREFSRRWNEMHGSLACKDLLGYDISTPEGLKAAAASKVFATRCPIYVRDAAALAEHLLAQDADTLGADKKGG